jgi:glycosyltransferase involved in cell wall biosynthesis
MTTVHAADDMRIFAKECRALRDAGYDVHLVAARAADGVSDGVRTWGVGRPRSQRRVVRMTSVVGRVYRRARALDADLYHFHDPELLPAALALQRRGAHVVYDAHEDLAAAMLDKPWLSRRLRRPLARITGSLEPAAAGRLAAVVTATPAIAERFSAVGAEVVVVNNYPRLAEFTASLPPEVGKERAVCYVGGISPIRGITTMVEAIAATDARLLLAGAFDPPTLPERLQASPGWRQVVNLGLVGRSEVAALFARAVAGVVVFLPAANHLRAQPTKMFEYMAAGLPVVASDFPLWREIVEGNDCGICVDPTSAPALAKAIRWLVDHPDDARRMGENGRRAVRAAYNWEHEAARLVELYRRILG